MFVVFHNERRDEADVCETLDDVRHVINERRDDDPAYFDEYIASQMRIYTLGEQVPFTFIPARFEMGVNPDIPAPLPGESVTDYAKRITQG